MFDIEVMAPGGAESLVQIGHALGQAGVSLEGGGMWSGVAHYLIEDAETAVRALADAVTTTWPGILDCDSRIYWSPRASRRRSP